MHPATCNTSVIFFAASATNWPEEDLKTERLATLAARRGGNIFEPIIACVFELVRLHYFKPFLPFISALAGIVRPHHSPGKSATPLLPRTDCNPGTDSSCHQRSCHGCTVTRIHHTRKAANHPHHRTQKPFRSLCICKPLCVRPVPFACLPSFLSNRTSQ